MRRIIAFYVKIEDLFRFKLIWQDAKVLCVDLVVIEDNFKDGYGNFCLTHDA